MAGSNGNKGGAPAGAPGGERGVGFRPDIKTKPPGAGAKPPAKPAPAKPRPQQQGGG